MRDAIALIKTIVVLLFLSESAWAQFDGLDLPTITSQNKGQKVVVLEYSEVLKIKNGGAALKIESTTTQQVLHLDRKGVSVSADEVNYDPHFFSVDKIAAATYNAENGKWKKKEVKEFKDVQSMSESSFYDSGRAIKFEYSDVTSGSITELNYTTLITDYRSLGSFMFQLNVPGEKVFYEVEAPNDLELGMAQFGDFSKINYTTRIDGSMVIHRWECAHTEPSPSFKFEPAFTKFVPHIFVYIKSYTSKGKKIELQGTKELLYKTNYEFVKDLAKEASPEMKAVVDSLKLTSSNEKELVKNVTYWVQDHIRYLAFEYGLGGFVPREAAEVCDRKFGDCKDMANLIKRMLDYAGVESYLCWIGTRSKGYTYENLPLGYCDNHMIAAYKSDGEYIFLDATAKHQPFGYPSRHIQGKQAMISIDENTFETPFVPVVDPSLNTVKDDVIAKIDGKNLILTGSTSFKGYAREGVNARLEVSHKRDEKEVMLAIFKRGNNKCLLEGYKTKNLENRDSALVVDYKLIVQDYVRELNGDLFVNMNFDNVILDLKPDTANRKIAAEYDYLWQDNSKYELEIPEGYTVKSKPNNFKIDQPKYFVELTYTVENNKLISTKEFIFKNLTIEPSELTQWVKDITKIQEAFQKTIQLSKKI